MVLTDIHEIRALLSRHGFRFSKSLGQNFLCAGWVPERIAAEAGLDASTGVLEIGPGIGCLTVRLAALAGRVLSVELDQSLKPVLAETLGGLPNVEVLFGDILKQDIGRLCDARFPGCCRLAVCANLPYQITSPALTALLRSGRFETVTVMIQREVARRICASAGTPEYGAFTLLCQWYADAELLFDVPPGCFIPQPKVTSSVIRLRTRMTPPVEASDPEGMLRLIKAAFQQRRKTLRNALGNGLGLDRQTVEGAISACGLPEQVRGEALRLEQFAALSNYLNGAAEKDNLLRAGEGQQTR